MEETLKTFAQLIKVGKVRAIGASNFSGERLRLALELSKSGLPRYEALQPNYNMVDRTDYEQNLEPVMKEFGIGSPPYFSRAKGFLTGKYRGEADLGQSPRGQGVKEYLNERGYRILAALDEVAAGHKANPARVALAWLIARPSVTAPIASATKTSQLEDLIESTKMKLTSDEIARLDKASA